MSFGRLLPSRSFHKLPRWVRLCQGVLFLGAGVPIALASLTIERPAPGPASNANVGEGSAEIRLPAPRLYAIVVEEPGNARMLYSSGSVFTDHQNPIRSMVIEQVEAEKLLLRKGASLPPQTVRSGRQIPDFPNLIFIGTVRVDRLQYRAKFVDEVKHFDPVVLAIEGSRAILEVEVPREPSKARAPSSPQLGSRPTRIQLGGSASTQPNRSALIRNKPRLIPELFDSISSKEVSANIYEVDATATRRAIDNVGQLLPNPAEMLIALTAIQTGMTLPVNTEVVDGSLSQAGFTLTNVKIAQHLGLNVGDTITSINGRAVSSPVEAYWTYQEIIIRNPILEEVRIDLKRGAHQITKLYKLR
jgi:hypothetical protein